MDLFSYIIARDTSAYYTGCDGGEVRTGHQYG